ncbi:MAG: hypothetical protein HQK81_00960 [Desulfovibrionaceae bacterium]|nr:hypothetical protein [Desulfovibrionaceae bacterium]MBF0512617.1 hypothetical protein [Desulfovibrionaceae bacterium]
MNDDGALRRGAARVLEEREAAGLCGLVGGLDHVVINTEPVNFEATVGEMLAFTGYGVAEAFEDGERRVCVLSLPGSADILVTARKGGVNPFAAANAGPKTAAMPNARLETFVFASPDAPRLALLQRGRGVAFLSNRVLDRPGCRFIQTAPSAFTGNSIGYVQWKSGARRSYATSGAKDTPLDLVKPNKAYLAGIGRLDHVATRVRAEERDAAILEFMGLTNYDFAFAVYVESLNSITSVARLSPGDYAQVFTSGIAPFRNLEESGPTEKFIYNYNTRAHHLAFETRGIEDAVAGLARDGLDFLSDLIGSREEGLKQIFSTMSPTTFLVNEYITRYDGFDGFFTKGNVTLLTKSTEKQ